MKITVAVLWDIKQQYGMHMPIMTLIAHEAGIFDVLLKCLSVSNTFNITVHYIQISAFTAVP